MTDVRLAFSLETLRDEINARAPGRNKASDGWIGDTAHQASASDHNPNRDGVVCALDVTHDPDNGADMGVISELLRNRRHPDCKYVIFAGRMFSAYAAHGVDAWMWRDYLGADRHTSHMHTSAGVGRDGQSVEPYDDRDSWFNGAPVEPVPSPVEQISPPLDWVERHPMMRGESIAWAQRLFTQALSQDLGPAGADGIYGPRTADAVQNLQQFFQLRVDRVVGPQTWSLLEYLGTVYQIV